MRKEGCMETPARTLPPHQEQIDESLTLTLIDYLLFTYASSLLPNPPFHTPFVLPLQHFLFLICTSSLLPYRISPSLLFPLPHVFSLLGHVSRVSSSLPSLLDSHYVIQWLSLPPPLRECSFILSGVISGYLCPSCVVRGWFSLVIRCKLCFIIRPLLFMNGIFVSFVSIGF